MYWKGDHVIQGGVKLMVKKDLVNGLVEGKRVSPRVITMEIIVNKKILFNISLYCTQSESSENNKEHFYNELSAEILARNGECIIMENFNARVQN